MPDSDRTRLGYIKYRLILCHEDYENFTKLLGESDSKGDRDTPKAADKAKAQIAASEALERERLNDLEEAIRNEQIGKMVELLELMTDLKPEERENVATTLYAIAHDPSDGTS